MTDDETLERRLEEAEETLAAIRAGDVDSILVQGPRGPKVYALEPSGHPYRILVEAMNEGAATLGEDGAILYCNSRFAALLGAPLHQVMGGSIHDWIPQPGKPAFAALLRQAAEGRANGECALRTRAGDDVTVQLSASQILEGERGTLCLVATDITRQKKELDAIVSSMTDALLVFDAAGSIVRANPAADALFGFDPTGVDRAELDRRVRFEYPDGTRVPLEEYPSARALRGESVQGLRLWLVREGARLRLSVSCSPIEADGEITGAVAVSHDVTAMEESAEALRQANERLENADRHKDDFLAILSHELRNPLAPILSGLYVLERAAPGGDQAREARAVLGRQVDLLTHLVDELLDITRVTRGKIRLRRCRVELNELVTRTLVDHQTLLERRGVRLELDPAPGEVFVNADASRIAQVLGNLVQNAAKFTPSGGLLSVAVSTDEVAGQAVLRVADTGSGMTPDVLRHLFEPFVQGEATLDRTRGGLGLGLALVKGLVTQHGGSVEAMSEGPGRGSEFVVRLPLDADADEERPAPVEAPPSGAPKRVLLIEDNADSAATLAQVLRMNGHDVAVAFTGPDGIEKARAFRPDVVLCDIGLPGMDGYAVARAIRADEALCGVRLVALTGYALPEDLRRSREAGFDRHLAKPPTLAKIESALEEDFPG